jgi:hypothetical protein
MHKIKTGVAVSGDFQVLEIVVIVTPVEVSAGRHHPLPLTIG